MTPAQLAGVSLVSAGASVVYAAFVFGLVWYAWEIKAAQCTGWAAVAAGGFVSRTWRELAFFGLGGLAYVAFWWWRSDRHRTRGLTPLGLMLAGWMRRRKGR